MFTKKIKIIFLFSVLVFCFSYSNTYAIKKAVFPDSKSLQPLPLDTSPNITKNIQNSESNGQVFASPSKKVSPNPENTLPKPETEEIRSTFGLFETVIYLLIFILFVYWLSKRHKSKN